MQKISEKSGLILRSLEAAQQVEERLHDLLGELGRDQALMLAAVRQQGGQAALPG